MFNEICYSELSHQLYSKSEQHSVKQNCMQTAELKMWKSETILTQKPNGTFGALREA